VTKVTIKKGEDSIKIKRGKHIVIIGMPGWQITIKDLLQQAFESSHPLIECPNVDKVMSQLSQLEPNLLIITNFDLKCSLTLQEIIEKSTVKRKNIVVLCEQDTQHKVLPLGVIVIPSKFHLNDSLIPVVQDLLS